MIIIFDTPGYLRIETRASIIWNDIYCQSQHRLVRVVGTLDALFAMPLI